MEILAKIVEYPIEIVGRQVGYVIHCSTNIQKLQARVSELKAASKTIEDDVAEAERKGEKIRHDVQLWLTTAGEITAKTDELLNEENPAKLKCLHGFCPNLTVRHQLGRKSTKLAQEVFEHHKKKESITQVSCGILREEVWGVTTGDYLALPSRIPIVKEIMDSLKDSGIQRMGVCGVGGVGKTTLVNEVYRLASEDKELFDSVVILLDVKEDPNPVAIQKKIVEKLGMDVCPEETKEGRASRLCARIRGKKILVILDDVQEKIELESIGLPRLPTCKILLTCRSRDVYKMRADKVFPLDLLDKKETWSLFEKMAGEIVGHKDHIQDVAVLVAEKCGGLPLLIVTVASALKEKKNASAWRNALRQLAACEKEDLTEQAYLALEWSYYQLDNTELQPLLLLCGIVVRHNRVPLVDLLKYGMGLGLFTHVNTVVEAHDKLETLLDKLKDFYLLLDSENEDNVRRHEDSARMHDLVCHVVNRIARRDQGVLFVEYGGDLKGWPNKDILRKCTKFSLRLRNVHTLPELPWECPEVELFLLQGENDKSLEIPHDFFKEMEKLKVMDFTNMCLPFLPSSMQYLKKLRTLCLDRCHLGDITRLGQLSSLEILSIFGSILKELPKEIGQLTRLRVLDVSECSELEVISPTVLSSLVRLENLRMRHSFNKWEVEGGKSNASISELKHLSQLSALEIDIPNAGVLPTNLFSHKLERFNITIGNARFPRFTIALNRLTVKLTKTLDESLKLLIRRSEELSIDETEVGIVHELDTEDFKNVKHLQLQNIIGFTHLVNRKVVFPILTTLRVHGCDRLRFLFSISMARSLVKLTHLQISECQLLQEIVSSTRESGEAKMDNMFSELKVLKLKGLPKLIRFSTGNYIGFSALEKLEIEACYELVEFIGDKVAMSSNDTRLICNYKESEQTISGEDENPDVKSETCVQNFLFNEKVGFPRLEKLIISEVRELKVIWHVQLAQDSFRRLRKIIVAECKNLISLFPPSVMGRLNDLETLDIKECESLEVVFELLRSSVEEIHVDASSPHDQLKSFCCQNLGSVTIEECNRLKSIFPASVARGLQQLTRLSVSRCDGIEEIVGGEDEEVLETTPYHRFVFPNVTLVNLLYLPQLTSFYPKLHVSQWPSLKQLTVEGCDKVGFLATEISHFGNEHEMEVTEPLMTSQKPLFLADEVAFLNLTTLRVHGCDKLRFLFSISMARSLVQLMHLQISACQLLQEIVSSTRECGEADMDNMFSELKVLKLRRLPKLIRFSTGNYIGFSALEELEIEACYELVEFIGDKVAVSSKDTRLICNCKESEQTISGEDENLDVKSETSVQNFLFNEKVGFPRLEKLIISEVRELKVIWHVQLAQDSFRRLRKVIVAKCKNLISLFPPSVMGRLNALKALDIKECESLEVVFELLRSSVEEIHVDASSPHDQLKSFCCQNLGSVTIEECNRLKSIFPASVARGLQQLTRLSVSRCDGIEEIVGEEDGVLETTPYDLFVFPNVTWVVFDSLPQLTSFYPRIHASQWPSLTKLEVKGCDKVGFLATEISHFGNEHEMEVMEPLMTSQKPLFLADKDLFPSLEDLMTDMEIWNGPAPADQLPFGKLKSITFRGNCAPFSKQASVLFLRRLQNLGQIRVCYNDSCEEIFVNHRISSSSEALQHVRMLRLLHLNKLMHLGNDNSQSLLFPNLETLELFKCGRLKSLESSAISFRNLITLEVFACNGLEYLTSYSVAKNLGKLKTLEVANCESVVVILASNVEDDDADDTAGNEVFSHLEHLVLSGLPSLQGFCSGRSRVKVPPSMTLHVYSCSIKLKISPNGVLLTEKEDQDQDEQKEDVETAQRNPEILSEKSAS